MRMSTLSVAPHPIWHLKYSKNKYMITKLMCGLLECSSFECCLETFHSKVSIWSMRSALNALRVSTSKRWNWGPIHPSTRKPLNSWLRFSIKYSKSTLKKGSLFNNFKNINSSSLSKESAHLPQPKATAAAMKRPASNHKKFSSLTPFSTK